MDELSLDVRPPVGASATVVCTDSRDGTLPAARLGYWGDLDVASAGEVRRDVDDLLARGFRDVLLDLTGLRFCDTVGLDALTDVRDEVGRRGGMLVFTGPKCPSLRLLVDIYHLTSQLRPR